MADVNVKINGKEYTVPAGSTILEAARIAGINIPTLCYLKEINAIGACRICVVEVNEGRGFRVVTACVYPVTEGMEVLTNTPKINKSRKTGKRKFIVIVSEGVGSDYAPALAKKIEEKTGVETKFARFAHIVRGGHPTLRDRLTATKMGFAAVELLLEGKSNLVVIEEDGKYVPMDIVFALTTDRMYKKKLKDGDLDKYNEEELAAMKAICDKRTAEIEELYKIANDIAV